MKSNQLISLVAVGLITEAQNLDHSFTAYDITKGVRDVVGRSVPVSHDVVRDIVENLYTNGKLGAYTRSVDNSIPGAPQRYTSPTSPTSVAPKAPASPVLNALTAAQGTTTSRYQSQVPNVTQTPQPLKTSAPVQLPPVGATLNKTDGKIRILKEQVSDAGFNSGQLVHVYFVPATKEIIVAANAPRTNVTGLTTVEYSVDTKNNIRINLSKLGLEKYTKFVANPKSNSIVISVG